MFYQKKRPLLSRNLVLRAVIYLLLTQSGPPILALRGLDLEDGGLIHGGTADSEGYSFAD